MTVRPIALMNDPVLRTQAATVEHFDRALSRLVDDMFDTMDDAPGAGLAAPQIGVPLAVFTFDVDGTRGHVVNPVLTLGIEYEADQEGCLSLPGVWGLRRRATWARVTGVDARGEPVAYEGEGYLARCFQHEVDHLRGELFCDGTTGPARAALEAEIAQHSWAARLHPPHAPSDAGT